MNVPAASSSLVPAVVADWTPVDPLGASLGRLTKRMAQGDEAAFTEFHVGYFPRLFRYVLVLMRGDEHAARDVTQETLLRVVRHIRSFEAEQPFWDWLSRLARSAAADHGRKASRYQRLLHAFGWSVPNPPETPDAAVREGAMTAALAQLSGEEAELLTRKYYRGESVRELAAHFAVTEEAVESRLARARKTLREDVFRILHHENS